MKKIINDIYIYIQNQQITERRKLSSFFFSQIFTRGGFKYLAASCGGAL